MSVPEETKLADVFAEMRRAREKHGAKYMGNLTKDVPDGERGRDFLEDLIAIGREAKFLLEEMHDDARILVLVEEVGELAEDIYFGKDCRSELVQCAAMTAAWLGIEPGGDAS